MPAWLDEIAAEEPQLLPGHSACAGCGPAINVRHLLGALHAAAPERETVLVIPASCWTIIAGIYLYYQQPLMQLKQSLVCYLFVR